MKTIPRYINANKLKDGIRKRWMRDWRLASLLAYIDHVPTEDVKEVKHAHWIKPSEMSENICSDCKRSTKTLFGVLSDYCPYCGAKMEDDK